MVNMKFKINKKAQLKIQQMAFVLIAVTLFFVLVGLFFLSISLSGVKQSAQELQEENARAIVTRIADSPEFSCGYSFSESIPECVDEDKVLALKENIEDYKFFSSNFWGVEGIKIQKVYPEDEEIIIIESNKGTSVSNFISLCKKEKPLNEKLEGLYIERKCTLARMLITYNA